MLRAEAEAESDTDRGWRFDLALYRRATPVAPEETVRRFVLTLSWQDYERWCAGAMPPSRVAESVARCAASRLGPEALPDHADASTLRRLVPTLDDDLRARLR